MKYLIGLFFLLQLTHFGYCQTDSRINIIKDTNYLYVDTINNKIYFGHIRPTGLVKTYNGNIVSTEFSIYFPEFGDITYLKTDSQRFFIDQKKYYLRTHVSSGSIFKLNNQLTKDWEVILKEKRVTHIQNYDSISFIAAGERTDQKRIWVAKINSLDGNILWFKELKVKLHPQIAGLSIAANKVIIVLTESKRLIPLSISKTFGRLKVSFFKEGGRNTRLSILNIKDNGKLNWNKNIHMVKKCEIWDEEIAVDSNIRVISLYCYINHLNETFKPSIGNLNFVFDMKGNEVAHQRTNIPELYLANINGWIFGSRRNDTVHIVKYDAGMKNVFMVDVKTPQHFTTVSMKFIDDSYYLFGHTDIHDLLICKLDKSFHLTSSWTYKTREMVSDLQLTTSPTGHLIIMGKCYISHEVEKPPKEYINLVEFN
ncbi:MAG: hypothetical protein JWR02_1040 [Mucilaginibacter sp.]|nr:hypothetical protein [Mucilaginibacter sp.]